MRVRGTGWVLFAFDIGFEVDLALAERRLFRGQRDTYRHKRSAPMGVEGAIRPPLRFLDDAEALSVGPHPLVRSVELALYEFGAVCVLYRLPFDEELDALVGISALLYENQGLIAESRGRASALLQTLGDAVREPRLADIVEDYVIYHIEHVDGGLDSLMTHDVATVARLLRAEEGPLSDEEVDNALRGRIGYAPGELVLVDWFASVLFGSDMEDERRVLELATIELLELRFLETRLEAWIEEAYDTLARSSNPLRLLSPHVRQLSRIGRAQADSAALHEGVDNALKLVGDDYLARLYGIAAERFHTPSWDASLERKFKTLDGIYGKLADLSGRRRAEVLEWLIILLIALEILLAVAA